MNFTDALIARIKLFSEDTQITIMQSGKGQGLSK